MGRRIPPIPEDCRRRLMPTVIDDYAKNEPNRVWASLPIDDYDLAKGYEDITYAVFANAIDTLAHFIVSKIGPSSTFETIAYLGTPDIRYHIIQMSACKTGHKVLFSSQLNSLNVHLSLMRQTACTALFSAVGVHVADILEARPMKHAVIPELDDLLVFEADKRAPDFSYEKTFEKDWRDPYVIFHTSGTTGEPKPVIVNHGFVASLMAQNFLPDVEGRQHATDWCNPGLGARGLIVTSPFHVNSACMGLGRSVLGGGILVPGFRHRGVDAKDICNFLDYMNVTAGILTPWMMEDIARRPDGAKYMKMFDVIYFGGAVLSPFASNLWAKHTRMQQVWGCTECLTVPLLEAENDEHEYVLFDVVHSGLEFRPINAILYDPTEQDRQLYEMVFTLTPEAAERGTSGWHLRQGITKDSSPPYPEFAIGDLWTPHPDPAKAKYAWRFAGRKDDLITFSSAVNIHPGPLVRTVMDNKLVRAAVMMGNMHRQPVLLIELADGVDPSCEGATQLWEATVQPINEKMPYHGRVARTHTILAPYGEFVRTPKGSVVRGATVEKFKKAIDEVYEKFGDKWPHNDGGRYMGVLKTQEFTLDYKN